MGEQDKALHGWSAGEASALAMACGDADVRRAVEGVAAIRRRIAQAALDGRPELALELAFALSAIDASLGEAVRELYEEMDVSLDS